MKAAKNEEERKKRKRSRSSESSLNLICLYFIISESSTAAEVSSTTFTLLRAPLIKSSLLPTQFTWHLRSGAVIISATCCRDESASPLAGSHPAALEGWRVKRVRLRLWLGLREGEWRLREKGNIRDELVQSAQGRAEAEQGSVN